MPQRPSPAAQPRAERARSLATSLHTYQPHSSVPVDLKEATYLLEESQNPARPAIERLRILGLMIASVDRFSIESFMNQQDANQRDADQRDPTRPDFTHSESHRQESRSGSSYHPDYHPGESIPDDISLPQYLGALLQQANRSLRLELLPGLLETYNVELRLLDNLTPAQFGWVRHFYNERIYPLLTPLAVDPGRPFPFISSFSLNVLVLLRGEQQGKRWPRTSFARVKIPRLLPRFLPVPLEPEETGDGWTGHGADAAAGKDTPRLDTPRLYVRSEEVVQVLLTDLFPGLEVEETYFFRVLRVAEGSLSFDNVLVARGLRRKQLNLPVVRVDIEPSMPDHLVSWLAEHLGVSTDVCFRLDEMMGQLHLVELANILEGEVDLFQSKSIFSI